MQVVDMQIRAAQRKVDLALRELRRHLMRKIEQRDGINCRECGIPTVTLDTGHPRRRTLDHIIPQVLGGNDTLENLQILCQRCNSSKGAKVKQVLLCPRCRGRDQEVRE